MNTGLWRTQMARLLGLGALACGIVTVVIGIIGRSWKLGVTGWFTGGILLALLAVILMLDQHIESRRRQER